MSPPLARISAMAAASALPDSGRLPSHAGLHPPEDRMNAIVNHLTPVAFMTAAGLGGLPQPMYRYGAAVLEPVPGSVPPGRVLADTWLLAPDVLPAASRA